METTLFNNTTLSFTYTGTKGTHLDMLFAPNRRAARQPPPGPVANAGNFIYDTSGANSIYNALQVRLQQRTTHGIVVNVIYTYGKSIDDASSIGGGSPIVVQNSSKSGRRVRAVFVRRRAAAAAQLFLRVPFGDRHRFAQKGLTAALFGNWRLSGNIARADRHALYRHGPGAGTGNTGGGGVFATRADQICDPNLPASERTPLHFFNTACFVAPAGRAIRRRRAQHDEGPGMFTWNLQMAKWFPFGKDGQHRVDVRWEITNLTNTPNFHRAFDGRGLVHLRPRDSARPECAPWTS